MQCSIKPDVSFYLIEFDEENRFFWFAKVEENQGPIRIPRPEMYKPETTAQKIGRRKLVAARQYP